MGGRLFYRLCYGKWLMLFFLKFQRDNRKMPWPWIPPRGKPEKGRIFHLTVEMKQPHALTEPFYRLIRPRSKCREVMPRAALRCVSGRAGPFRFTLWFSADWLASMGWWAGSEAFAKTDVALPCARPGGRDRFVLYGKVPVSEGKRAGC